MLDARSKLLAKPPSPDLASATTVAESLRDALNLHGLRLAAGLHLAKLLTVAASSSLKSALLVLARYPVLAPPAQGAWSLKDWNDRQKDGFPPLTALDPLSSDPDGIAQWTVSFLAQPAAEWRLSASDDLWSPWKQRFQRYFGDGTLPRDIRFAELVAAASGEPPSTFLRIDLPRLSAIDASRLALSALPLPGRTQGPRWALVAALRLLGFGVEALASAAKSDGPPQLQSFAADVNDATVFFTDARPGPRGLLSLYPDGSVPPPADFTPARPVLYVSHSDYSRFQVGLDWLAELDVFDGVLDQDGSP